MHILIVANHWSVKDNKTFAGIFIDRQISSLREQGVQISTFDLGTSYSPLRVLHRVWALRKFATDKKVDLVHARYGTIIAMASVLAGFPTVITYGGSDLLPGASVSRTRTHLGIFLSNIAALRAKALICVSEELRETLWWRKNNAQVIPDGVDIHLFTPGDRQEARQKLGWALEHPVIIINAARDPENKGLPLAKEAMHFVKTAISSAELKVIPGVHPEQMPLWYQAADVFLSASRQEGSPNVIKEAMACNLPVVSTSVGDAIERLNGVSPSVVIPRKCKDMGEALIEILNRRERSNGREHIKDLSLENTARRVIKVYENVLNA